MSEGLCASASTKDEWYRVALAALSMAYRLRAKEVFTDYYEGEEVVWTGEKGRRGRHAVQCEAWTTLWAEFLRMLRALHGYHPHTPVFIATRQHMRDLIRELASRPRSASTMLLLHSWRRRRATTVKRKGAPTSALLMWRSLRAPSVLQVYAKAPPGWNFIKYGPPRRGCHWGGPCWPPCTGSGTHGSGENSHGRARRRQRRQGCVLLGVIGRYQP